MKKYVTRLGEHIKLIHKRLDRIDADLAALADDVGGLKEFKASAETSIEKLEGTTLPRSEFDEFVREINEVFEAIPFPPIAEPGAEEAPEEEEEQP